MLHYVPSVDRQLLHWNGTGKSKKGEMGHEGMKHQDSLHCVSEHQAAGASDVLTQGFMLYINKIKESFIVVLPNKPCLALHFPSK